MAEVKATESNITITPTALENLMKMQKEGNLEGYSLRVFVKGIGCSGFQYGMGFDNEPQDDDTVIEFDGLSMIIDPASLMYMVGSEVDYKEGPAGAGFAINNPNETSSCGSCGSASGCGGAGEQEDGCGC